MNSALSLLTICRKAGKLELGMDPVKDACNSMKAKCVLVSKDISPKSLKEIKYVCSCTNTPILSLDCLTEEVWAALGRKSVVLAVCDTGFYKKLSQMLEPVIIKAP